LYIRFIGLLFSQINNKNLDDENPLEPYHKTYLGLFQSYKHEGVSEKTKAVIETTMGAMIFYMPQNAEKSWSKRISRQCFMESIKKPGYKKVKDHEIPRKLGAKLCLERDNPFNLDEFREQYWNRFSSFTYVTTEENMSLVNWYLDQDNLDENGQYDYVKALNTLKIEYLSFPDDFDHRKINKKIKEASERFKKNEKPSLNQLKEFINQ
jgi:hypothetical protein